MERTVIDTRHPTGTVDALNAHLSIAQVMKILYPNRVPSYGVSKGTMDFSVMCPFHRDTKPSLRIYQKRNVARCFGVCGKTWTPVSLWAEAHSLTVAQSSAELQRRFNIDLEAIRRMNELARYTPDRVVDPNAFYRNTVLTKPGIDYLSDRRISKGVAVACRVRCSANRLLFPHYPVIDSDKDRTLIYALSTRSIDEAEPHHTLMVGPFGYVPFLADRFCIDTGPIFLTEAPLDALSLVELGYRAVAVRISALNERTMGIVSNQAQVVLAFDADQAGLKAQALCRSRLNTLTDVLPLPHGSDLNEQLRFGNLEHVLYQFFQSRGSLVDKMKIHGKIERSWSRAV